MNSAGLDFPMGKLPKEIGLKKLLEMYTKGDAIEGYRCDECSTPAPPLTPSAPKSRRASRRSVFAKTSPTTTCGGSSGVAVDLKPVVTYRDAIRQVVVKRPGPLVRFHLKRFRWAGTKREKIQTHVKYPLELDLRRIAGWNGDSEGRAGDDSEVLDLTGVICHEGRGMGGGHYFAYCKLYPSGEWYLFNDYRVTPATEIEVQLAQAYMLFYSQRGAVDEFTSSVVIDDQSPAKRACNE
jgi:hypothetical protein